MGEQPGPSGGAVPGRVTHRSDVCTSGARAMQESQGDGEGQRDRGKERDGGVAAWAGRGPGGAGR